MDDHWFDALHKALLRGISRRTALPALGMVAVLLAGDQTDIAAKKGSNRGKQKKKGTPYRKPKKRDPKKPPRPPGGPRPNPNTCSGGDCARAYPRWDQAADREWCEFICEQCDGDDPREFCLIGDREVTLFAACCEDGMHCCNRLCVDTNSDDRHCGACNRRCSPGKFCFGGECLCQEGLTLCGNTCRDTVRDRLNCGQCGRQCRADEECVNGDCVCEDDRPHCNGRCCAADSHCLNEEVCCPDDYIGPFCPTDPPNACRPDSSIVCCDGFSCSVGVQDPAGWFCVGHTASGHCFPYSTEDTYAPLKTHQYGG